MASADRVVSIRVPADLPEKMRALTGQPFSKIVRFMLVAFYEAEKAKKLAEGGPDINTELRQNISEIVAANIQVNPEIPKGEVHFRDPVTGELKGKIINLGDPA